MGIIYTDLKRSVISYYTGNLYRLTYLVSYTGSFLHTPVFEDYAV